jgi:tellurite resistance protein TerC
MSTPLHWIAFNIFVLVAVALDLGVFHRKLQKITVSGALKWSLVWMGLAVAFGAGFTWVYGRQSGLEFFTGYTIEKSLSVDNLFVFLVVFRVFAVKDELQPRVLGYGIVGALLLRGLMIWAGTVLLQRFEWITYLFGAFIVYAGAHMFFVPEAGSHPEKTFLVRYFSKHLRLTKEYRQQLFFTRENGVLFATPLVLVLLVIEITDVTFALDSIPAVFGITRDPFIVYTSNVFAILGLRALYFLLAGVLDRLKYLEAGLAFVLIFVGGKMIAEPWFHISVGMSLLVVLGMLAVAVIVSLLVGKKAAGAKDR